MFVRVDIETSAGVIQGDGPISSASSVQGTARLDRAGTFSFRMPAASLRSSLVQAKRVAHGRALVGSSVVDVAAGIVDRITQRGTADDDTLDASGDDLLRELTYNLVDGLGIYEEDDVSPADMEHFDDSTDTTTLLPLAHDGNLATHEHFRVANFGAATSEWLYIGHSSRFTNCIFTFVVANFNTVATKMQVQYFTGRGWTDAPGMTDGTQSPAGTTWGQNGTIAWTLPADWVTVTHNSKTRFWIRMRPDSAGTATDTVAVAEMTIHVYAATLTGPQLIIALAPAGWSLDVVSANCYNVTQTAVYYVFGDNVTVLQALVQLAELTGEHFRLGTGRTVQWIQDDQPDSGLVAHMAGSPDFASNANAVLLTNIEETTESYEVVNRVYPYGGGLGAARLTIQNATETAPAGYTAASDARGYYIEKDGATPRISRSQSFDIRSPDAAATEDLAAVNQLFRTALAWLQSHDTAPLYYRASVTKLPSLLKPGDLIRVVYLKMNGTYTVENIDANLLILEVTNRVDADGILSADLTLSTVARWPETNTDRLLRRLQVGASGRNNANPVAGHAVASALVSLGVITE